MEFRWIKLGTTVRCGKYPRDISFLNFCQVYVKDIDIRCVELKEHRYRPGSRVWPKGAACHCKLHQMSITNSHYDTILLTKLVPDIPPVL